MDLRQNCWEFKKCGRDNMGINARAEDGCPAYPDHGSTCARVAGTLCGGRVQGDFAQKLSNCMQCDFYKSPNYDKSYKGLSLTNT